MEEENKEEVSTPKKRGPKKKQENSGSEIGNAIKDALLAVEETKVKPESIRLQEQADEIAQMKRNQLQDLTTPDDQPIGYTWVDSTTEGFQVKSTEAHMMHIQVTKKEHVPRKKDYIESKKVVKVYTNLYTRAILTNRFKEFDAVRILHDPRSETEKDAHSKALAAKSRKK